MSFRFGSTVIILVGPKEHRFEIHKDLLCQKSAFFKTACSGSFKEAEGVVRLPDQDADIFKYFVHWLYTEKLSGFYYHDKVRPTIQELEIEVKNVLEKNNVSSWFEMIGHQNIPCNAKLQLAKYRDLPFNSLIYLFVLADFLDIYQLKDVIITTLIKVYFTPYNGFSFRVTVIPFWDHQVKRTRWCQDPAKGINLAWKTFNNEDYLCKVLLRLFNEGSETVAPFPKGDSLDISFVIAAYARISRRHEKGKGVTPWRNEWMICRYHEHAKNEDDIVCPHETPQLYDEDFQAQPEHVAEGSYLRALGFRI